MNVLGAIGQAGATRSKRFVGLKKDYFRSDVGYVLWCDVRVNQKVSVAVCFYFAGACRGRAGRVRRLRRIVEVRVAEKERNYK
jgi:hypothetical protein